MATINDYFKDNVANLENAEVPIENNLIKWKCPMSPYVKINFDGSVSNSLAAGGFVIKNRNSKPILICAMNLGSSTINVAKALALREAPIWARRRSLTHVLVKSDSKIIIDPVCGVYEVSWNLRSIIEDIRWCASSFQDIKWGHVFKEANFVANAMAYVGLKIVNLCIWDACLPVEANLALLVDCNGSSYVKGFSL
ncbi:uncharacterized protein [Malus domestica]|uniref:uncharacterized protein n=1 Tax=Malus domestica TaxID=3750 RepID=UPI0004990E9B